MKILYFFQSHIKLDHIDYILNVSSPGDLSDPGIKPMSPALVGGFFTIEPPGKRNDDLILEKTKGSYGKLLYVQLLSTTKK